MRPHGPVRVLGPGEIHRHERFGPEVVNRGAVLWECEWDGGVFESGAFLGGVFHSGTFRGGVVWATYWKGGAWEGGLWHHGFGPDGSYRPRGAFPGNDAPGAEAPESPVETRGLPRVTVFAASVHNDLPRLWLACLARFLPKADVRFEVFDDSPGGTLDADLLPGASVLRASPTRPDFQVAYADALRRATTPLLAFVDTDVFWLSPAAWPRILETLERPNVAGVACLGREAAPSPGTFAVVMKTEIYRRVLRSVRGGFTPSVESAEEEGPPGRWRGSDTGDRVARAVAEAGFEVPRLDLPDGAFVRFDAITMTRLVGGWVGEDVLLEMAAANPYFRRGCLGALALARIHDAVFPDGPRFSVPVGARALWRRLLLKPRTLLAARRDAAGFEAGAARIRRALAQGRREEATSR